MTTDKAERTKVCPKCKRAVVLLKDDVIATHGPGPRNEFICPGSGDKAMVKAAKHIKMPE